ncbi:4-(cytidine 5'-diphospho)-2-C-methyl-D-erythritol kinase [Candidatus Acetothermia bacterium]|nr:4-(cytidine 5'-diphospho)-2-C-methyl-D-erythritol kinase [Candidatus Acetothermia bacterium]MBI3643162.1 4-(cytidine 5'-diphospho)-2-C-methyl-D-erythritol kinase [Candidatus Acetothermia bacterium]
MSERVDSLQIEAYAKINLGLKVLGRRPDGFHNIDTIFQSISLADQLQLKLRQDDQLLLSVNPAINISAEENLVIKAAQLLREKSGVQQGVSIQLTKNIPIGAGLGGGSTDAAATLVGLNRLLNLKLKQDELKGLAIELGSDVPFFLEGGRCRGQGRGESLTKVPYRTKASRVILFSPPFALSTKDVYSTLDSLEPRDSNFMSSEYENDLEHAALKLSPELADFSKRLSAICLSTWMSGSGASYFTIVKDAWQALAISKQAENALGCKCYICKFTEKGYRIIS